MGWIFKYIFSICIEGIAIEFGWLCLIIIKKKVGIIERIYAYISIIIKIKRIFYIECIIDIDYVGICVELVGFIGVKFIVINRLICVYNYIIIRKKLFHIFKTLDISLFYQVNCEMCINCSWKVKTEYYVEKYYYREP